MVDAIRHLNGVINNFYLKCIKFVKNSVAFSKNCALKWLKYIIIVLSYQEDQYIKLNKEYIVDVV